MKLDFSNVSVAKVQVSFIQSNCIYIRKFIIYNRLRKKAFRIYLCNGLIGRKNKRNNLSLLCVTSQMIYFLNRILIFEDAGHPKNIIYRKFLKYSKRLVEERARRGGQITTFLKLYFYLLKL